MVRASEIQVGNTIFYKSNQILAFADDIVIISRNISALRESFTSLNEAAVRMGLVINTNKTKYMCNDQTNLSLPGILVIDEHEFERTKEFRYLGSVVTEGNNTNVEIRARILAANKSYFGMIKILKSKILPRKVKINLYKTLIRPVLTYGAETWTLTKTDESSLMSFERKILRRIFGPVNDGGVWRRRYNLELYQLYKEHNIIGVIKSSRIRWLGHLMRMSDGEMPRKLLFGELCGKRRQGRPKLRWLDDVTDDLAGMGIRSWRRKTQERETWRKIVEDAKAHFGLWST